MMEHLLGNQDELAQRVHELEMIAQVSTAVSSILDLDTLLHQVLVRTKNQFNLYHVNLALLDETGQNLVPVMGDNDMLRIHTTSDVPPIPLNQEPSIVALVARERRVILVNNVHEDPDFMPHPLLPKTQSELTVPMVVGAELIGVMDVQAVELNRFTETDVRIHATLAAQFAIAIQNARAYQQSQQRSTELAILNEMSRSLNSTNGIQSLLTTFYEYATRLIDTSNLFVGFYEPQAAEAGEILFPLNIVEGELIWLNERRPFGNGLTEYVIKTKQPLLIEANVPERLKTLGIHVHNPKSKSWIGVPMLSANVVIGVIGARNYTKPRAFNENSLRLLVSMANQVALAVENARLFAKIQEQTRNLEAEVAARTIELTTANEQLRTEVLERKQAEQALTVYAAELERSNQELDKFAYTASHDLQEPLRKITVFGDRLKVRYADKLDERGLDYLDRMQSASERMQRLISDLLSLSRVITHSEPFSQVSLNDIVGNVLLDLEFQIEETNAIVEVDRLPNIEADATQMRQLNQNLIGNALKFFRPNIVPHIQISSQRVTVAERELCQLRVRDNGIGIEEQYQTRIFEVFERLHTRQEYEGTGVGLAICRKIVERHNGAIWVESVPNEFTDFVVQLPFRQLQ